MGNDSKIQVSAVLGPSAVTLAFRSSLSFPHYKYLISACPIDTDRYHHLRPRLHESRPHVLRHSMAERLCCILYLLMVTLC